MADFSKIENEELRAELEAEFDKLSNSDLKFTQADIDREINKVSQKLHKEERELKEKLRKEVEAESKLDADEKAQIMLNQVKEREKELAKRENRIDALAKMAEKGIDPKEISEMIDLLVTEDKTTTEDRVSKYLKTVDSMKEQLKEQIIKNIPDPNKGGGSGGTVDKAKFNAMSYAEKLEFKEKNPDLFTQFMTGK